uniref:Single domain-containing protein n=1 Tax=Musca domestica TaxID=7370 RepID=A0A1I8MFS1_MUSDO
MKLIIAAIISALCCSTLAAISSGIHTNAEHPGKCVYKDLVLAPGENGFPAGKCEQFFCFKANGFSEIHTCGAQEAAAPCIMGDLKLPNSNYPLCCERYVMCPL